MESRPNVSHAEWEIHRPEITDKYIDHGWRLEDVMTFMRNERGFSASHNQYKSRLTRWGLRKNKPRQPQTSGPVQNSLNSMRDHQAWGSMIAGPSGGPDSSLALQACTSAVLHDQTRLSSLHPTTSMLVLYWLFPPQSLTGTSKATNSGFFFLFSNAVKNAIMKFEDPSSLLRFVDLRVAPALLPLRSWHKLLSNRENAVMPPREADQDWGLSATDRAKLQLFVYVLSNDLAEEIGCRSMKDIWTAMRGMSAPNISQHLSWIQQATLSTSLCYKLIQGAIEADDAQGVEQLLRLWHIKVDDVRFTPKQEKTSSFSAVELASGLVHGGALKALLRHGNADVNQTGTYLQRASNIHSGGALYWLMHSTQLHSLWEPDGCLFKPGWGAVLEVLRILIDAGVDSPPPLRQDDYIEHRNVRCSFNSSRWQPAELKALQDCTKGTLFSWVFEKALFAMPPMRVARSKLFSNDQSSNPLDLIRDVNASGLAADASGKATAGSVLRFLVAHHESSTAVRFLVASGCTLDQTDLQCVTCGQAISTCLQESLHRQPRPEHPYFQLQEEIVKTLTHRSPAEALEFLETAAKERSAMFWKASLLSKSGRPAGHHRFLLAALKTQNLDLVTWLLEHAQDDIYIDAPLLQATWANRNQTLLELVLLSAQGIKTDAGKWALRSADVTLLRHLANCRLQCNDSNMDMLHLSIRTGKLFVVECCLELMLEDRLALEEIKLLPFDPAVGAAYRDQVLAYRDQVLEVIMFGRYRLRTTEAIKLFGHQMAMATREGYMGKMLEVMAGRRPDFHTVVDWVIPYDYPSKSILGGIIEACNPDSTDTFDFFMSRLCDKSKIDRIAKVDADGAYTPLLLAIQRRRMRLVQTLVGTYKASVSRPASRGVRRTPLQQAAHSSALDIARWLIEQGAQVNEPINQHGGATALQYAAMAGSAGIVELLLSRGAQLSHPGAVVAGRTALQGAAEHDKADIVKLLLDSGAEFYAIDSTGKRDFRRAEQYAIQRGNTETQGLFKRYRDTFPATDEFLQIDSDHPSGLDGSSDLGDDFSDDGVLSSDGEIMDED